MVGEDGDDFFLDLAELNKALQTKGDAGQRAIARIAAARSRYPVTEATLEAAATVHALPVVPEHSFHRAGYSSSEEVKEHLRFIVKHSARDEGRLPELFAAVDVWYPTYEWARDECGEDNDSPGWDDPELIASLK